MENQNINLYGSEWEEIDKREWAGLNDNETLKINKGDDLVGSSRFYKKVQPTEGILEKIWNNEKDKVWDEVQNNTLCKCGHKHETNDIFILDSCSVCNCERFEVQSLEQERKVGSATLDSADTTPDTNIINLNDYEQVDSKTYAEFTGERIVRWLNHKQLHFIKKENKFPKEFETGDYIIAVDNSWIDIGIHSEKKYYRFSKRFDLPILIKAVEYYQENSK